MRLYQNLRRAFPDLDAQYSPSMPKNHGLGGPLEKYRFMPAVFYCKWAGLEHGEELADVDKELIASYYPYCCFSHYFGMPTLKKKLDNGQIWESEPLEYNSYQKPWIAKVAVEKFFSLLKCRGAGASELLTVRWKIYRALINHIHNRKWVIIAGTKQELAIEFLVRMKELCDRHPWVYAEEPKSKAPTRLRLGCSIIEAASTDIQASRGYENVEEIELEEPSAWRLTNDDPVLESVEAHAAKSGATIQVKGTARGRRGFFYHRIWSRDDDGELVASKYERLETFVDEVLNAEYPLLSAAEVEKIRITDPEKYRQEFKGEFIVPENSLFGEFEEKNISKDFVAVEL